MAPRCNQSVFCCASATHDLLTAAASVSDIVFDVLVTIQFYRDHLVVFCTVSIIIFAIAQAAYAFLFTSSYASHLKPSQRVLVFLAVLPIAQLIPVFAWIESLHWPGLQLECTPFARAGLLCTASGPGTGYFQTFRGLDPPFMVFASRQHISVSQHTSPVGAPRSRRFGMAGVSGEIRFPLGIPC
eukprot:scaffold200764_cov39-Tisochrysis_lutea.AAC.1